MKTQIEIRQEVEREVVRKLIDVAQAAGWTIPSVDDGEAIVRCDTVAHIMEAVFSVDECQIRFKKEIEGVWAKQTAYIVLGNDGWDCIADNSTHPAFQREVIEPMDEFTDKLMERALT